MRLPWECLKEKRSNVTGMVRTFGRLESGKGSTWCSRRERGAEEVSVAEARLAALGLVLLALTMRTLHHTKKSNSSLFGTPVEKALANGL